MTEPELILAAGDLHGDPQHTVWIFQRAVGLDADAIMVVGDFGYWEHQEGGDAFLDLCSQLAIENDTPVYWVDGNHENHTKLRADYGPGGVFHDPTPEGFWTIREGLFYVPRGTRWTWSGVRMMGLGGAYSVDKKQRLEQTEKKRIGWESKNEYRRRAGAPQRPFPADKFAYWWPEEELTDTEVEYALRDPEPIDILFTHDKPRASNPRWNRKAFLECLPNQDKIQTVVNALHPKLLVHGHLHFRYTDEMRCGDDGLYTRVEGLNCNGDAQMTARDLPSSCLLIQLQPTDE